MVAIRTDLAALLVGVLSAFVTLGLGVLLVVALVRRRTHHGQVSLSISWKGNGDDHENDPTTRGDSGSD